MLGKSCKPIPVMVMGAFLGKKYPLKKYANVALIVAGVALFMHSGSGAGKPGGESGGQVRVTFVPSTKHNGTTRKEWCMVDVLGAE